MMHNFRELKIWKRSRELVSEIYKTTKQFPADELYGLTSQIRRCSVSIPANISEGCGRTTTKELIRFLDIANGSAFELETLLIIANDIRDLIKEIQEIEKMIFNFKLKLKNNHKT